MISKNEKLEVSLVLNNYFEIDELKLVSVEEISVGICNKTYKIGFKNNFFILQRLNRIFTNEKLIKDYVFIASGMKRLDWKIPLLLKNKNGKQFFLDAERNIWRIYTFIPGKISDELSKLNYFSIGSILAKFHSDLSKIRYRPTFSIQYFHDFNFIIQKLEKTYKKIKNDKLKNIAVEILNLYKKEKDAFDLGNRRQLIHGDSRIENFLFKNSGDAFSLIDLDTFMMGSIYVDIGDLVRSINLSENQTVLNFSKDKIKIILEGYLSEEKIDRNVFLANALSGLRRITIELCTRFIIDTVEDCYFGWDESKYKSRKENNIARVAAHWNLFNKIQFLNLE